MFGKKKPEVNAEGREYGHRHETGPFNDADRENQWAELVGEFEKTGHGLPNAQMLSVSKSSFMLGYSAGAIHEAERWTGIVRKVLEYIKGLVEKAKADAHD